MRSRIQTEILNGLHSFMKPIVRFLLRSGIGFREFSNICKVSFVEVATSDYGIRGRPTNISRVAVMTGLTRKEVKSVREKIDAGFEDGLWLGKLNLPTQILHYWHNDPDFCETAGTPTALPMSGSYPSFTDLVHRYAGDIPAGAMRVELMRAGAVVEKSDGKFEPTRVHYIPEDVDEKFVRSMYFALANLASTLVHNANVNSQGDTADHRRLERYVWTARISPSDAEEFKALAEHKAAKILSELDDWIGAREQLRLAQATPDSENEIAKAGYGLGVYSIESDR
jgi:hypothetical protein